ncbi:MAG: hypothetical protein GY719_33310 [bacterium]|nr:hypothetical protein [bacterium]
MKVPAHRGTAPRIELGVRIAATPEAEPPTFFVRDNGIGIDQKYHDKVFGLFERLDPDASTGTEIGLAMVMRIDEIRSVKVWLGSEGRGRGSTFCIVLPRPRNQIH